MHKWTEVDNYILKHISNKKKYQIYIKGVTIKFCFYLKISHFAEILSHKKVITLILDTLKSKIFIIRSMR